MLTKNIINNYNKELKKLNDTMTPFEYFANSVCFLIRIDDASEINGYFSSLLGKYTIENMDEVNGILQLHNEFYNSSVNAINTLMECDDEKKLIDTLEDIFDGFFQLEGKERFSVKLLEFIDQVIYRTIDTYEINLEKQLLADKNKLIEYIENIFHDKDIAVYFVVLMSVANLLLEDDNRTKEEIKEYFFIVIHFVMQLNSMRLEVQELQNNEAQFIPRSEKESIQQALQDPQSIVKVGRNEPCPCGSGKKYKKCCMNKQQKTSNPLDELEIPMMRQMPLSKKAIDEFYTLWSRFINFVDKELCKKRGTKHKKLYYKDEEDKYSLDKHAYEDGYYFVLRGFLLTNFNALMDEFIRSTRVSKTNIEILQEWKEYRTSIEYGFIYERVADGAIVWDMSSSHCYYVHDLYSSLYDISASDKPLNMLLLPFRGRIIYDGVIGHSNIALGDNSKDGILNEYCKLRKNKEIDYTLFKQKNSTKILQLRIDIKGAKPKIWRRILVQDTMTYESFHYLIQDVFEWENEHLYEFSTLNGIYTDSEYEDEFSLFSHENKDASQYVIGEDLRNIKDKISYTYDFGDDWEHEIVVEEILEYDEDQQYPKCIKGKNQGPFENIGGISAYNEIVEALKNKDKKTLENYYIDEEYDPTSLDLDRINDLLGEFR
jgi:hypothetical protein